VGSDEVCTTRKACAHRPKAFLHYGTAHVSLHRLIFPLPPKTMAFGRSVMLSLKSFFFVKLLWKRFSCLDFSLSWKGADIAALPLLV
jgi:hypothetical protein